MSVRDGAWADEVARRLIEITDEQRPFPNSLVNGVTILRYRVDGEFPHLALDIVYRHPRWDFTTGLRFDVDDIDEWWPGVDVDVEGVARRLSEEIGEPLGAEPLTIAEDGTRWWGDGPFPGRSTT